MTVKELIFELLNKTELDNEITIKIKGSDKELSVKEVKNISGFKMSWLEVE